VDGCEKPTYTRNLCGAHYKLWRQLSDDERVILMKPPDPPHWEFEGDEAALIAMTEQQELNKARES